ncbi:MAG: sulfatase [Planctomycetota bacterium]
MTPTLRTLACLLFVSLSLCVTDLCAQDVGAQDVGARPRRPNLLLVVTDDQRFDQMSCAGHPVLETPRMDRLADRGVRFTNAFVTTAICAASRASILTGRREGRHGYTFGKPPMGRALGRTTYPMLLRQAGYRTGFVGKWGVKFEKGAIDGAFDYRKGSGHPYRKQDGRHLTDIVTEQALTFLRQQDGERPFCLSVSFHAPHAQDGHEDQYLPPEEFASRYQDAEVPIPPLAESGFAALPPFLKESLGRVRWHWRFDERAKQVRRTKDYWRMIDGVDRGLGRILDELERKGVADDTVVVFTSDNGYFLGERGLAGKWLIYEESVRVPLIVCDPRAANARRGVVSDAMALNIDLAPTLLAYAGVEAPSGYDGASLVPLVQGEQVTWRDTFAYEHHMAHPKIPPSVGVRGPRFVYARYYRQQPAYEQLFDLQNDPEQLVNLAGNPAFAELLAAQRTRCNHLLK